ncbi:MAG TPA: adenosylcobalamin-dependent ribonucleoside-diphosphate reductase [Methanomassiliicoccales archaeon]|nr:adenosylcobalamin-dependent ribonucleoside-diphosphate reductase [Methanomassiliicoccales archaeon]
MAEAASLSENALVVLQKRYLLKDENGNVIETPEGMFRRVAKNVASANDRYSDGRKASKEEEEFFGMMSRLEFLPNSPALMNAATELQQLAACFVIPVEDSIEGIYEAIKWAATIQQSGGGVGYSFSRLRPAGDIVKSTMGIASGPVSFMKVFDSATDVIKQGGRRRGASMGILRVDHPDVETFIHSKDDLKSLANFNISVAATDEFMERAKKGEDYELINPRTKKPAGKKNAAKVFDDISKSAWRSGDPGMIFIDTINRTNPTPGVGQIESTNPCGEVPLLPFEACNLGSMNLDKMLTEKADGFDVDWERLSKTVDAGIRFLDNVIDVSKYPLPQIDGMAYGNRKIGLGVMGFADALVKLNMRYGSEESIAFATRLVRFIRERAEQASRSIADARGSFPNISKSVFKNPRRNATLLSIAPTGTISMIASCSSGIEPLYALSYVKHVLDGSHLREIHPYFIDVAKKKGFWDDRMPDMLAGTHSIREFSSIPPEVREVFVTSYDVTPEEHVLMQAAFQEQVDNAVSKTINLPAESTKEQVRQIYALAYERKCKGITIYREGSRPSQVLTAGDIIQSCPDCGSALRVQENALVCPTCGYMIG